MKTTLDCIPCFARQALQAARFATDDPQVQETVMRAVLREVAEMDMNQPPPVMAQWVHRRLRALTGSPDPYRSAKDDFNRLALELLPAMERQIALATDPLALAVRYAIAGNAMDLGPSMNVSVAQLRHSIETVLDSPFEGDVELLRRALNGAEHILYLADNTGEIVFDRLLIQQLPPGRVTVAVRGAPILNDATLEDARTAGLHELAEVIDNGSDAPGTLLSDCSDAFVTRFRAADLIIAKGQGNYETLSEVAAPLFFLLKVKCSLVGDRVGLSLGTHALVTP